MLTLYRQALRLRRAEPALGLRRAEPALGDGPLRWLPAPEGVLAFARDPGFTCVVNLSPEPVALPAHETVLLTSAPLVDAPFAGAPFGDRALAPDSAAWLRMA
jgi:alpha-glucosidase